MSTAYWYNRKQITYPVNYVRVHFRDLWDIESSRIPSHSDYVGIAKVNFGLGLNCKH